MKAITAVLFLATATATSASAVEIVPFPATAPYENPCPNCKDILNFRTGMPCNKLTTPDGFQPTIKTGKLVGGVDTEWLSSPDYSAEYIFERRTAEPSDILSIRCTSPLNGNVIYAMRRDIRYKTNPPIYKTLLDDVRAKYGQPQYEKTERGTALMQYGLGNDKATAPERLTAAFIASYTPSANHADFPESLGASYALMIATEFDKDRLTRLTITSTDWITAKAALKSEGEFIAPLAETARKRAEEKLRAKTAPLPSPKL